MYLRRKLPWERLDDALEDIKNVQAKRKHKDIIVVASFIEKVPNLGGLTRTCNIFNASALVIPSIQTMEVKTNISLRILCTKICPEVVKNGKQYMRYQRKS